MNRVFVSYSRRNKNFAERLARDLSDAGLDVWIDFRQIQGGELWQDEIYRGIDRSDFLIVCLSPDAVNSEWVGREIKSGRERSKLIIPVMAINALKELEHSADLKWLLNVHFINFVDRYEQAFPELLEALPGARPAGKFDKLDSSKLPNPFKGLEAFQQTDAHFFFGREDLIRKGLEHLNSGRFLAIVGASGSGKSSLVRAGIIPAVRDGKLPGSDNWPIAIFTPGEKPLESLATRLLPLLPGSDDEAALRNTLSRLRAPNSLNTVAVEVLANVPQDARLVMVVDQFEEVFTRAPEGEREPFLDTLQTAATQAEGRVHIIITMRADFFGQLSRYPKLAELFEQDNLIIATEMTPANLLRSISGPAEAIGLKYDDGLVDRILADVSSQPGSLPLLQYALRQLFEKRDGYRLTTAAYEAIGGVRRALAQHAENIYRHLNADQQEMMERVLLRLVEVNETGEATRRKVNQTELTFRGVDSKAVLDVIDRLTAQESRLLIASREIKSNVKDTDQPTIWLEVSHEALIREWDRFKSWVAANLENLRYNSELMKSAQEWNAARRDPAYLLRGNRLPRAEVWLETADATPLQREFIAASMTERDRTAQAEKIQQEREMALQAAAARRLRFAVIVLVVAFVSSVILTLDAVRSRGATENALATSERVSNDLVTQSFISDRQADEAHSLALAAAAEQSLSDNDTDLGVVLAVEANQIENPPPQSQRAFANVVYSPGTRLRVQVNNFAMLATATSPDGQWVAIGDSEGVIHLHHPQTGEPVRQIAAHTNSVSALEFGPNGETLFSAGDDGRVVLWNVRTGELIREFAGGDEGFSFDLSPNGTKLLAVLPNNLLIWNVADGSIVLDLPLGNLQDGVFASDSETIFTATNFIIGSVNIRTNAARTITELPTDTPSIALALSSDGSVIAGGAGTNLILWSVDSGEELQRLGPLDSSVNRVLFMPDNLEVLTAMSPVSGATNGTLRVWDVLSGRQTLQFEVEGDVSDIALSADGKRVIGAIGDGSFRVWDVRRAEEIRRFVGHDNLINSVAVSPNGRFALSGSADGTARYWDVDSGLAVLSLAAHKDKINGVAISAVGWQGVTASSDQTLILWDFNTGEPIRTFTGQNSPIQTVAFSPDGTQLVSGAIDGSIILWDVETGRIIRRFTTGEQSDNASSTSILTVRFSPDGQRIVSGTFDGSVAVWDVASGTSAKTSSGTTLRFVGHVGAARSAVYSPDGTRIVSGGSDRLVILWDAITGEEIRRFNGHDGSVTSVDFTPDMQSIISSSFDGTIRLWDIQTGFETRRYTAVNENGRPIRFLDLSLHGDGRWVLSGMNDNTMRQWLVLPTSKDLLDWTFVNRYLRVLTCDERAFYEIEPLCASGQTTPPPATPPALPTATATPEDFTRLGPGVKAIVNTTGTETLNLRNDRGLSSRIITTLERGTEVTLIEGPRLADGLFWWFVQIPDGRQGWVAEAADGVLTLLAVVE